MGRFSRGRKCACALGAGQVHLSVPGWELEIGKVTGSSLACKNYDGELVFCVFTGNDFQMNSVIISSSPLTVLLK